MIVSTLSTYPGKKVVKDLGIVFAYDDAIRFNRIAMNMDKYLNHALDCLADKAKDRGVNAVLGICFDIRDTMKPMLMGTAVILELPYYLDQTVIEDLGYIYAYDDQLMLSRIVDDSIKEAMKELTKKAEKRGANAILGVHMTITENSRVMLSGQAVVIANVE